MTDRLSQMDDTDFDILLSLLKDENARVRAAAIIGLGRMLRSGTYIPSGEPPFNVQPVTAAAGNLLPLTITTTDPPQSASHNDDWRNPHPERVIPHLAVKALVDIGAIDECLEALKTPYRSGALQALQYMHDVRTVDGLFKVLSIGRDDELRRDVWTTLIRLYHREGDFIEDESPKWWGTRPDTTGPYYHRVKWSESDRIAAAIKVAMAEADEPLRKHLDEQIKRHVLKLDGLSEMDKVAAQEPQVAIKLPSVDPANPNQIANMKFEDILAAALKTEGNAEAGQKYFQSQACISCHTYANGQNPKGPHLVDIGKRYRKEELLESILDPNKKIAQGFDTWTFVTVEGRVFTGFVVLESAETVIIRQNNGLSVELLQQDIEERVKQETSMMPKGIVGNLTPQQLADLTAWLQSLH